MTAAPLNNSYAKRLPTAHTPGPWIVGHPYSWYGRTFTPVGLTHSQADGRVTKQIASVGYGRKQALKVTEDFEEMSNARLIAAAPELLEALRAVVSVADRKTVEFDKAHAAIAKAEGRS